MADPATWLTQLSQKGKESTRPEKKTPIRPSSTQTSFLNLFVHLWQLIGAESGSGQIDEAKREEKTPESKHEQKETLATKILINSQANHRAERGEIQIHPNSDNTKAVH